MAVDHDRRMSSGVGNVMQPMLRKSYVSPRPASRVGLSSDAAKYLRRNRGSSSLWLVKRCASIDLDDDEQSGCSTVRATQASRCPRISGDEALEIFHRSQGSVGIMLDEKNQIGYNSPRPQPRLPSREAEANARRKAGLFEPVESNGSLSSRPRSRMMSAEAEAIAAKNADTMSTVLKSVDRPTMSKPRTSIQKSELSLCLDGTETNGVTRPRQRVKPEAEEIARKNAGTCAAALAGRLAGDPVCDVRTSGAGRENYEASRCGSVRTLFSTYGQQSASASVREVPGNEVAKHGKTGTLCFLMNNYGNLPRSPRPASRLRSEGKRHVGRNRGNNMADCLTQSTKSANREHFVISRTKTAQLRQKRTQQHVP